ncbi:MAG: ATP-dependent DNA helicase RecG [Gammaproteobacteria bacterium]|nr:ATP-dependent DNA helicase RecG [Gammaproteobacteria bacterium]
MTKTTLANEPVTRLSGVGPALGSKLERIGLSTLQDLLFHLPLRYEDRTRISPIGAVRLGENVVLEGDVISTDVAFGRRRSLQVVIKDDTGLMALRFFHFSKAQQNNLSAGSRIRCYGEVRRGRSRYEIYHPEYTHVAPGADLEETLTPVYPATEGLTQARIRKLIDQVLALMADGALLDELLPVEIRYGQSDLREAIEIVHRPPPDVNLKLMLEGKHPAQRRLAFEELMAHFLSMRLVREQIRQYEAPRFETPGDFCRKVDGGFSFAMTGAQKRVVEEIQTNLTEGRPMLRLLQGDVGSGKTVVAAMAAAHALENQYQTAIMAPTEILAEQHFINFSNWFSPLGVTVAWLSGKVKGKSRTEQLGNIASGAAGIVIGTHALFQADVTFRNLGLVVIDEQHRFGVKQRLALREKGRQEDGSTPTYPHQLVMTATPIPRTLTMSMYADMDVSMIDELPPGRTPVTTAVIPNTRRGDVVDRVHDACTRGVQAYWVCTLIDESDQLQAQAAEATATALAEALPDVKVGLIHGRMSAPEKEQVMNQFKARTLQLLVATTVIEVGVDVPNASLMIIENPERLGLAQLHQLRGRVGRGQTASHCLLMYHPPLGEVSKERLNVIRQSTDGFVIAEQDLRIRGPGELLGSRQAGSVSFRVADIVRDRELLPNVREKSLELLRTNRGTAQALVRRWLAQPDAYASA